MKRMTNAQEPLYGTADHIDDQDLCRRHGLSEATFYKYKARFGGMTVSDAQKRRTLAGKGSLEAFAGGGFVGQRCAE